MASNILIKYLYDDLVNVVLDFLIPTKNDVRDIKDCNTDYLNNLNVHIHYKMNKHVPYTLILEQIKYYKYMNNILGSMSNLQAINIK